MSTIATNSSAPIRLALTPGEPAGIGPDLALAVACVPHTAQILCFADPELLAARAAQLGCAVELREVREPAALESVPAGVLQVFPLHCATSPRAGQLDTRNARYVLDCLDAACDACAAGALDGMVTGPVQKSMINEAGMPFSGHTEYLAERLAAPLPVMVLVAGTLRVALVTTHVALRQVPDLITQARVVATVEIVHRQLREQFGLAAPRIAVCGLNPHAGENRHLGCEDDDEIRPAVAALRARGWSVDGPLPADTAFTLDQRRGYDAIVAMYHDQGLAALKAVGFGESVNVTFGLPIVRTSVDHGTALALAGKGSGRAGSLEAAIEVATALASARKRHGQI
ncbi:MAG: 4-hydroxythreonine-4-phosphate dehydrogenase PdxA [Proteobacteria bacterium]|nr:4-hydroxythreonine-4-phosphate dehydrogenase PdxA [Pseudomonadota bacterium]